MKLSYSEENWNEVLKSLGYTEQKNPNRIDCYDIYDENGIPKWQYSGQDEKELWYYFFAGQAAMQLHTKLN